MNGQMIERMNERMNERTKGNKQGSEGRYFVEIERMLNIHRFIRISLYLKESFQKLSEKDCQNLSAFSLGD